jgi:hypothetical protein
MSLTKISSNPVPHNYPHIRAGDLICWHFAIFEDLMTEKSRMISTSFLTGMERGMAGRYGPELESKWFLREVLRERCFLGEKSIWKWR